VTDTPQRIQLKRTKGWRMPPNTVKVDRSTKWGNPYKIGMQCLNPITGITSTIDAAKAVDLFRSFATPSADIYQHHLRGKNLACWCKPGEPCHADVLLELANQ
jgi:hypothetical protein